MFRSLIACLVIAASFVVFDSSEAQAHRRWVRRPIARAVLGPPIIRRPVYRGYYGPRVYGPRVSVGVGFGGGYYW